MIIRYNKWVLFNFFPYEYKALEKYLDDMALKGWKLQSIKGVVLKFKKIEPKRIIYSVDVMDKVSFFDGKNSDSALEYREYCKAAGWDFICEREKIQVYCSESETDRVPIHTDEKEKFNCIFKASLKYVLLSLFTVIIVFFTQCMMIIGSYDARFLANNLQLLSLCIMSIFTIHEIIRFVNFINWMVKGRKSLKREGEVSYDYFKVVKIKRIICKLMLIICLVYIVSIAIMGEIFTLKISAVIFLMAGATSILMNFVSKTKYKKKRKINIISYVVIIIFTIIIINGLIFNEVFFNHMGRDNKIKKDNYILNLKDFNDEAAEKGSLYTNENNSFLASTLFYSNKGKNVDLGYELFQSKYEWAVKYDFNNIMNWMKKINIKYIEKETDLPEDIKVYMNEKGHKYLMVSSNKLIEINSWDKNLSEGELLNKVYEKVFK